MPATSTDIIKFLKMKTNVHGRKQISTNKEQTIPSTIARAAGCLIDVAASPVASLTQSPVSQCYRVHRWHSPQCHSAAGCVVGTVPRVTALPGASLVQSPGSQCCRVRRWHSPQCHSAARYVVGTVPSVTVLLGASLAQSPGSQCFRFQSQSVKR